MTPDYSPVIRAATPEDADMLAELARRTFLESFVEGGFAIPYPPEDLATFMEEVYSVEVTRSRLQNLRHWWEVAEVDGVAVAYSEVGPGSMPNPDCKPENAELKRLYVASEAQGLGVGTALLQRAMAHMDTIPGPQWLSVWSGNEKAQRLYQRHGFRKDGEYGFPVGRWRDHEFIYRRG